MESFSNERNLAKAVSALKATAKTVESSPKLFTFVDGVSAEVKAKMGAKPAPKMSVEAPFFGRK